jgi:SAM-dependent methyltransferase
MPSLLEFVRRSTIEPWQENAGIPWSEPGFSRRMLHEHLSQDHDRASRREAIIDAHTDWMHNELLGARPSRVLDLGCGPGLYTSRLARLGHGCVGLDISPAAIAHAEKEAKAEELSCTYRCEDVRNSEFGVGFDLIMLIFGELNAFAPEDARALLLKIHGALTRGGTLLLEVHSDDAVRSVGSRPPFWYTADGGLFSERPHVLLQEHRWLPDTNAAAIRYAVVDAERADVQTFVEGRQAYSEDGYKDFLTNAGFRGVQFLPALPGAPAGSNSLIAIIARKAA